MHDEEPFCQDLTEHRRKTVRFLGQPSEMTIDDTWPQAGEMRSLWKGTTELCTNDMPQDDTWKPNRHHSSMSPLFRNHLTRNAVAMFPPPPNPVASIENGCRDSHLPGVPHTEEKGRRQKLFHVYSSHHDDPSGSTESQEAATEAANPSSQRQDPSGGTSPPPGQALGKWHGKGKYVSAVRGHQQRQGRDHWNQQVDPEEIGDRRGEASFQPDVGGTHRTGSGAGRGRRSQEIAGGSPCEGTSSPEQSDRSSIPSGTGDGGNVPDQETVGGELGTSRSMRTGQKKRLLGGIKKTKAMWERWYEAILEEEKLQSNEDITVQCIDFCEATTSEAHAVLQHARVLVATVDYQENPHLCMQILHAAMFQVFRGAYILLRALAVTESQETQGLLDEIQQQPSVFVLSGPATVITNVATASAFPADRWSTESVSRVVRTARTRQENHEKERAEHAYYSHMHDEVTMSDIFPATEFREYQRMTRKMKQNSPYPTHCRHEDKFRGFMRTWGTHRIAHWYGCYVLVEPSSDSFQQPPSTVVMIVKHRDVQLVQS